MNARTAILSAVVLVWFGAAGGPASAGPVIQLNRGHGTIDVVGLDPADLARLSSGVLAPPNYTKLFGLFIEIVGVAALLLVIVNRKNWTKSVPVTSARGVYAGIAAVIAISFSSVRRARSRHFLPRDLSPLQTPRAERSNPATGCRGYSRPEAGEGANGSPAGLSERASPAGEPLTFLHPFLSTHAPRDRL